MVAGFSASITGFKDVDGEMNGEITLSARNFDPVVRLSISGRWW
jgi:hypothetical protein